MPESSLLVPNYVIQGAYGELKQVTNLSSPSATNEIQSIEVDGGVSAGTFTLTFAGHTTGAIAYNASAATVKTALAALVNLDAADLTTTGGVLATNPVVVTFAGAYAGLNVPTLVADGSGLTGGSIVVSTTTQGDTAGTSTFLANVHQVQGKFTTNKIEVRRSGTRKMGYKRGMITGDGTITQFKVTSDFLSLFVDEFHDELTPPSDIVLDVLLDDPEALGTEQLRLSGVKLWEIDFGWNVGDMVDEAIPYTFEDAELIEAITGSMVG